MAELGALAEGESPPALGRFELGRRLGSGGMGVVYEAIDRSSGARLALKLLHEHTGPSIYQFKHEFRALAEFSHPGVVRFGELFEESGRFFITMELVIGEYFLDYVRPGATARTDAARAFSTIQDAKGSLGAAESGGQAEPPIPRSVDETHDGTLDIDRLRNALAQLSSALMALHASGLVHRDIKPQNILVTPEGRLVLLDFGLALEHELEPSDSDFAGTVAYMAPEQAMGLAVTEATDWYSVGIILYQALTGKLPHAGPPHLMVARRRRSAPPPPLECGPLPGDLWTLCVGLLEPDPARRLSENAIALHLGLNPESERQRASFRSQLHFSRGIFVNRDAELAMLRTALAETRTAGCRVVCLVGDSGVGKSALMRRWMAELASSAPSALVLSGRCYERDTVPFRGVDGVVDALARHLQRTAARDGLTAASDDANILGEIFPVLRGIAESDRVPAARLMELDPHEARRLAFAALRDTLRALAEERHLVIHIDDAQWIDQDSLAMLSFLAEGDAAPRMLLAISERPRGPEELRAALPSNDNSSTVLLSPLGKGYSEELAAKLLKRRGGVSDLSASTIAEMSGGHPLFIHELVLHDAKSAASPGGLDAAILTRVEALEPPCLSVLTYVAIASTPLPHVVVRAAANLLPSSYPWVLSTLRGENFVNFRGLGEEDEVHTSHDRIRELVTSRTSAGRRREMHARLAVVIEALRPHDLDALAYHFTEAGVVDKASSYAYAAAERALGKLAFEQAARFFELILSFERDRMTRGATEEKLAFALANAGRGTPAAAAYLRAAQYASGRTNLELRRRAGEQLLRSGHLEHGIGILSDVLRDLGMHIPKTDLGTVWSLACGLLQLEYRGLRFEPRTETSPATTHKLELDACWTLATGLSMVHHLRATDFLVKTLLLALEVGDGDRVLKSAALLGATLGMASGLPQRIGRKLAARAHALAADSGSVEHEAWLSLDAGAAAMGEWNFEACERYCREAEAVFKEHCVGSAWEVATAQAFLLWSQAFQGKIKEAAERLPDLLSSARARGDRHAIATLILSPLHLIALAADQPERLRQECVATMAEWPPDLACFQHMCGAYVLAHVDLYERRGVEAWAHFTESARMLRRSHLSRVQFQRVDLAGLRGRAALARAAAGIRGRKRWLAIAEVQVQKLERERIPSALGMAALIAGGVKRAKGRSAEAEILFDRARAHFAAQGMRLHASIAELARSRVSTDEMQRLSAEKAVIELGVVNPNAMLGVWVPGLVWN